MTNWFFAGFTSQLALLIADELHLRARDAIDAAPRALDILHVLSERIKRMSAELDALIAQVERSHQVTVSAVTLISGIADRIAHASDDPAKLTALADDLRASSDALAAAVAANTPAAVETGSAPAPTAEPAPAPAETPTGADTTSGASA